MACADCGWKYPDSLLHAMQINEEVTDRICGICALERSNKASGVTRLSFKGDIAESMRQAALKWRKNHPTDAPTVM